MAKFKNRINQRYGRLVVIDMLDTILKEYQK